MKFVLGILFSILFISSAYSWPVYNQDVGAGYSLEDDRFIVYPRTLEYQGTYGSLAGTSVARDFVELPSQVMENWVFEPEVLKTYVNKTLAHLDKEKLKKLPTIKDLDDSIDLIVKLVKKYYAIFHAGRVDLQPIPQRPWKNIFEVPWVLAKK